MNESQLLISEKASVEATTNFVILWRVRRMKTDEKLIVLDGTYIHFLSFDIGLTLSCQFAAVEGISDRFYML